MKQLKIEIPQLPPSSLSPNSRANWAKKYQDAKQFEEAVYYCCVDARNRLLGIPGQPQFPLQGKARLSLTFIYPEKRVRDIDNITAAFKPGVDGIVKAGLIKDDDSEHLEMGTVNIIVDRSRVPATIIELDEIGRLENEITSRSR